MNIINLAHGAFVMLGAYMAYVLFSTWHVDPFLSMPIAFVVLFVFGYCVQRFVINFVVRAPILTTFLLTFGLSLLIVNFALLVFHGDAKGITTPYSGSNFSIGPRYGAVGEAVDAARGAGDHGADAAVAHAQQDGPRDPRDGDGHRRRAAFGRARRAPLCDRVRPRRRASPAPPAC